MKLIYLLLISITLTTCTRPDNPYARQVILIGVDGMSPHGLQQANTPNMDSLMARGASSMHARAVMPTSSGANWGSMLLGAGPEQHGITFNSWRVDSFDIAASQQDEDGYFPSIFDLIHHKIPQAEMGVILDWEPIANFFNHKSVNLVADTDGTDQTIDSAINYILKKKPIFTFIHLDEVDHAGHQDGHGTPAYFQSIERVDQAIGKLVAALKNNHSYKETHIIISADHGGIGTKHGGNSMEEIEIPWIITGPEIAKGVTLDVPINTYDTPATIAFLFSTMPPYVWTGRPVMAAFERYNRAY